MAIPLAQRITPDLTIGEAKELYKSNSEVAKKIALCCYSKEELEALTSDEILQAVGMTRAQELAVEGALRNNIEDYQLYTATLNAYHSYKKALAVERIQG